MKGKRPILSSIPLLLGFRFRQPDRGDLRLAIGAAGDHQLVHCVRVQALDRLDADRCPRARPCARASAARRRRRSHRCPAHWCAQSIDDDHAPIGFHAKLFEAEIFDIADDADGGDHAVGFQCRGLAPCHLDGRGDVVRALVELRDLGIGVDFDPCFSKRLRASAGDLRVFDRQDLRQELDHGHLGAQRAIERGELDADRAGADDEQRLRHLVRHHRLKVGPDQLAVGLEPGSTRGRAPVAMMMCFAWYVPAPSAPFGAGSAVASAAFRLRR